MPAQQSYQLLVLMRPPLHHMALPGFRVARLCLRRYICPPPSPSHSTAWRCPASMSHVSASVRLSRPSTPSLKLFLSPVLARLPFGA